MSRPVAVEVFGKFVVSAAGPGAGPPGLPSVLFTEELLRAFTWNCVPMPPPAAETQGASSCSKHLMLRALQTPD